MGQMKHDFATMLTVKSTYASVCIIIYIYMGYN